ncbi:MAG: hypothetical protein KBD94_12840 [Pyrinomonadaceae bacterium]|nr:hypothetical protein [Pyrinomonadaceae bacterium]
MRFLALLSFCFVMFVGSLSGQTGQVENPTGDGSVVDDSTLPATKYVRPNAKSRRARFVKGLIGPGAWARMVASAGWGTSRNSPREWGPHWDGFGKRLASNFGKRAVSGTVRYSLDEAFKLDSKFYRTKKKGVGNKVVNALVSVFTARRPDGSRTVGVPRLVGTYASNVIASEFWYPSRYTWKDGLRSGTMSLGVKFLGNLFKELVRF